MKPTAHALLIGISKYTHWRHLPAACNDATDLHGLLTDPHRVAVPPAQVQLLRNHEATLDAISAALTRLATDATPGDTVWIFFSGHGARITAGQDRGEYLVPVGAPALHAEAFAAQALSTQQLSDALKRIRAERLILVLDCCHAAGVGVILRGDDHLGLSEATLAKLSVGKGRAVLSAARADEPARELPGARNGLFTTHLLDGLRGKAYRSGEQITVTDLFSYARNEVGKTDSNQHPVFKLESEEDFPVARWLGAEGRSTGITPPLSGVALEGDSFEFDAYLHAGEHSRGADFIREVLRPALELLGLRIYSADDFHVSMDRIAAVEDAIQRSRYVVVVLTQDYSLQASLGDQAAQYLGTEEGRYRLIPVMAEAVQARLGLRSIVGADLSQPERRRTGIERLARDLRKPPPEYKRSSGSVQGGRPLVNTTPLVKSTLLPLSTHSAGEPGPKQVSDLLYEVLRIGSSFDAFCLDCFPELFRRLSSGMDRESKHTLLLTEHDAPFVAAKLQKYEPARFERYANQFLGVWRPSTAGSR